MNKLVDSESLGKFKELMDEKLKNKVSKKMKSQVIIGRAIKPRACEIGGMENWYAFAGSPTILLPKGCVGVENVYVRSISYINYDLLDRITYKMNHHVIQLVSSSIDNSADVNCMYRVDKYEINEANLLSIWLTFKENAEIQRGTVLWMEINYGKKYDLRKIMTPEVITDFIRSLNDSVYPEGVSKTASIGIVLERFGLRYKNSNVRDKYPIGDKRTKKLKWGKLKFIVNKMKPEGSLRFRKMCGKYRIRLLNKRNAYTSPIIFFIKGNGNIII